MTAGVSEVHNPFHEFFEITEPGRVIVHTVFSGNGERESEGTPTTRTRAPVTATGESVIHFANCDLCDSRIHGDRYVSHQSVIRCQSQILNIVIQKCLNCPDFDTCVTCFRYVLVSLDIYKNLIFFHSALPMNNILITPLSRSRRKRISL